MRCIIKLPIRLVIICSERLEEHTSATTESRLCYRQFHITRRADPMACDRGKHSFLEERSRKIRPVVMNTFFDKPVNVIWRHISQSTAMVLAKVQHVGCSVVIEHGAIASRDIDVGTLSRNRDGEVGIIEIVELTFSLWARGRSEGIWGALEVILCSQGCFKGWFGVVDSVIYEPLAVVSG